MILYLGNKLSAHGNTPTSVETLGTKLQELNFKVITKSSQHNKFLRLLDMLFSIFKYKSQKPVVIIDTYSTSAFWFAYISARFCTMLNLKYISILRGGDLPDRIDKSKIASLKYFCNSFENVATSGYLEHEFKKRNFDCQVINNYIELNKYPFTHRKNIQPKILWVRSFHKIYNPKLALQVLKIISVSFPEATLCMVGPDKDGTLEECKQLASKLNLKVKFTGRLEKQEWITLSRDYDIFINTTNVDNTPISVMEAMALGMPVITTNAGGIPFLINNGLDGLLVSVDNANEMAEAILILLNNFSKASEISLAARKKSEEWDWSVVGPKWKTLIDKATHSGK